ncbi:MAG: cupin domain-containing protein [Kofleriaceae bacterium]|nr:cupin domain-containing protein [Kofleriaceae bacterium]
MRARPPQPSFVVGADAAHYPRPGGGARILVEPPAAGGAVSLGLLELDAGVSVPAHVHARETEALYVLAGGGAMTVAGAALAVTATSVVQVPAGVEHAFTATAATRALQLYTPAGPEQRFKPPPPPRPRRP